jgi:hypothetical protein
VGQRSRRNAFHARPFNRTASLPVRFLCRELCREKDSRVCGASCRQSVGNRGWLPRNRLLLCKSDEQPVNLALLMWDGEAGLCHKEDSATLLDGLHRWHISNDSQISSSKAKWQCVKLCHVTEVTESPQFPAVGDRISIRAGKIRMHQFTPKGPTDTLVLVDTFV